MSGAAVQRDPVADLVPGELDLFVVALEEDDLAVVIDRVCAQPAGIELEILVLGPPAVMVMSAEEQDARGARTAHGPGVVFGVAGPGGGEQSVHPDLLPVLRCEIRMPGLATDAALPRIRVAFASTSRGESNAYLWIRPLPPEGDVICQLTFEDRTETVTMSGDLLRSAAAAGRSLSTPGPGPRPSRG